MIFKIFAEKSANDTKVFLYDNIANRLWAEDGFEYCYQDTKSSTCSSTNKFIDTGIITKSKDISILKIQLGLSCNYTCDYCSQKFVERPAETSKKDIDTFISKLDNLRFSEERGLRIEFWGGEPFVYWKTLKPLAEALQDKFSDWNTKPTFSVITNGSLLSEDICAWLYAMNFSVAISHDGPGQHVRGPDPFDDPIIKDNILNLYKVLKPLGKISFNSMLSKENFSRKAIYDWFVEFTKDEEVSLGEGTVVDAYDADGVSNSFRLYKDQFLLRQTAFNDIYSTDGKIGFNGIINKIDSFITSILEQKPNEYNGQKCGMDREDVIAVDLNGNVITCQNVSAAETSMNGNPHLGGNIDSIEDVAIKTATHWKNRPSCISCPVLALCKGSCMFLEGDYWETSCDNSYSDNIALLSLAFERITGYIPVTIESPNLPAYRSDIWGTTVEHKEKVVKKVIPIKLDSTKIIVNDVEVYTKTQAV